MHGEPFTSSLAEIEVVLIESNVEAPFFVIK